MREHLRRARMVVRSIRSESTRSVSVAGKLWNLTFVVRADRCFVWQLLRLTAQHTKCRTSARTQRIVRLR